MSDAVKSYYLLCSERNPKAHPVTYFPDMIKIQPVNFDKFFMDLDGRKVAAEHFIGGYDQVDPTKLIRVTCI